MKHKGAINTLLMFPLVAFLVGCDSPDEVITKLAKENISQHLKDPESARFRDTLLIKENIERSDGGYTTYVCGVVDGKNSYGAFTGGTRFVAKVITSKNGAITYDEGVIEAFDVLNKTGSRNNTWYKLPTEFESIYWNIYCIHRPYSNTELMNATK